MVSRGHRTGRFSASNHRVATALCRASSVGGKSTLHVDSAGWAATPWNGRIVSRRVGRRDEEIDRAAIARAGFLFPLPSAICIVLGLVFPASCLISTERMR